MDFLVYVLFLWVKFWSKIIPLSLARKIAKIFGNIFFCFIPIRKKVASDNLKLCFPEKTNDEIKQILKGAYVNIVTVLIEFFYLEKFTADDFKAQIKISNLDIIQEKLNLGKGLIVLSGHFGNWEMQANGIGLLCREPLNVIVKEQSNIRVNREINKIREALGNRMINMKNSLREGLSLLRQNKILAILGDQTAPKDNSYKINFFINGVPAFGGAAAFALKTGCPIVFGVMLRNNDGTYSLEYKEVDTVKYKEYNEENIQALTQEHSDLLKEAIIKRPDHWLWFHRRFKHIA